MNLKFIFSTLNFTILNENDVIRFIWRKAPNILKELAIWLIIRYAVPSRRKSPGNIDDIEQPSDRKLMVFGNFRGGGGISRSAERYCERQSILQCNPVLVDTTDATCQPNRKGCTFSTLTLQEAREYTAPATIVIHLNPPHFLLALARLGKKFLSNKRIVAYWAWELQKLPMVWRCCLDVVDEIEVPSTFTKDIISKYTAKPVRVVPPVGQLAAFNSDRKSFGTTGKLRCLFIFDLASSMERKNPEGAIKAFCSAFTPIEGELTIKVLSPHASPAAMQKLYECEKKIPHLHVISEWLTDSQLDTLYRKHDVYLSLHRSEGFGSTIFEATRKGLYVVATGWSGNMDFMRGDKVFPVPCVLKDVPHSVEQQLGICGAQWAHADTDAAARILQQIFTIVFPGRTLCNSSLQKGDIN
ncbi:glycosyltransferase [uncultured Desulfovibrio sp.]|uniref:glycosyltransferase n=1 Tax=uncultured Desulfovibrio sp. TaxID=167968 RepID=UPI00262137F7|nr:glycosyltransferase [uncultured Desulfovibrio sp.]